MIVYRIVKEKHADSLVPPRMNNRWNSEKNLVLYTAWSRSLACLENLVHRSGEALSAKYSCMVIEFPDSMVVDEIPLKLLTPNWKSAEGTECRTYGDTWAMSMSAPVLKVPSALVEEEHNYLFNIQHPEYKKIKLLKKIPFAFDARLKAK
jgi:RES domain-containing protein